MPAGDQPEGGGAGQSGHDVRRGLSAVNDRKATTLAGTQAPLQQSNTLLLLLLLLALGLRLVNVNATILGMHSWRQADTAAIARNYLQEGSRFSYPVVDWGGAGSGRVETEFPLYPFAIAATYRLFGVHEWLGRLLSILASLATLALSFRLVRRLSGERTALWSSFLLAVLPLNVFYGRAIMPESWMLASSMLAVFLLHKWVEDNRAFWAILSAVSLSLACLLKLPALYLGLPLAFLFYLRYGRAFLLRPLPYIYALIVLIPVALWYRHAHQIAQQTGLSFGIWGAGTDKWGNWDLILSWKYWNKILFTSIAERHLTWPGFLFLIGGLWLPRARMEERLFDFWLFAILVYFVIVGRGNYVHEYYQLPLALPACVFAGKCMARAMEAPIRVRVVAAVLLVAMLVLSGVRLVSYWKREDPATSGTYALAQKIREFTTPSERIITLDQGNPTLLYLAARKGWHASPGDLTATWLEGRVREGASLLAGEVKDLAGGPGTDSLSGLPFVHERHLDERFFLLGLSRNPDQSGD